MGKKYTKGHVGRIIATGALTIGYMVSVGLLSFCGIVTLNSSPLFLKLGISMSNTLLMVIGSLDILLAGGVEGEIYKQQIWKGISNKRKLLAKYGKRKLIVKSLHRYFYDQTHKAYLDYLEKQRLENFANQLFASEEEEALARANEKISFSAFLQEHLKNNCSDFMKDYFYWKNRAEDLKKTKLKTDQDYQARDEAIRRAKDLEDLFIANLESSTPDPYFCQNNVSDEINAVKKEMPWIRWRLRIMRLLSPLIVIASLGSGLATAFAVHETMLQLIAMKFMIALSAAALSAIVWPLAIIAAIGYLYLIYQTIHTLIYDDELRTWFKDLKAWGKQKPNETNIKYGLRLSLLCLGVVLAAALATCATIATGTLWWKAVKKGAVLISKFDQLKSAGDILKKSAVIIRNIITPLMAFFTGIFNIANSLASVKIIAQNKLSAIKASAKKSWRTWRSKENGVQMVNPFRMIIKAGMLPFIMLGHMLATGITTTQFPGIPKDKPIFPVVTSALSEGAQDLPFFKDGESKFSEHIQEHMPFFKDPQGHHDHGNIPERIMKVVFLFSGLFLLSSTFDYLASQLNRFDTWGKLSDEKRKPVLTFIEAWKINWRNGEDAHHHASHHAKEKAIEPSKPLSTDTLLKIYLMRCENEKKRLAEADVNTYAAGDKKDVISYIQKHIQTEVEKKRKESTNPQEATTSQDITPQNGVANGVHAHQNTFQVELNFDPEREKMAKTILSQNRISMTGKTQSMQFFEDLKNRLAQDHFAVNAPLAPQPYPPQDLKSDAALLHEPLLVVSMNGH